MPKIASWFIEEKSRKCFSPRDKRGLEIYRALNNGAPVLITPYSQHAYMLTYRGKITFVPKSVVE